MLQAFSRLVTPEKTPVPFPVLVLAVLHTWGQLMNDHLHSHNMVPGGDLSLDGQRWIAMPRGEFLPLDQLRRIYRDLFVNELRKLYRAGKLAFPGPWRRIEAPGEFEEWHGAPAGDEQKAARDPPDPGRRGSRRFRSPAGGRGAGGRVFGAG